MNLYEPEHCAEACSCEINICELARYLDAIWFDCTRQLLHAKVTISSFGPWGNVIEDTATKAIFNRHTGHSGEIIVASALYLMPQTLE